MSNDDAMKRSAQHQECWELLPWLVNGRLAGADSARVSEHVRECARCSAELHAQQRLYEAMRQEEPVLLAPQAALKKLWQRVDGVNPVEPARPASASTAPESAARTAAASMRRMRLALAAQALLIVGLLGLLGWQSVERWQTPRFVTLTSSTGAPRAGSVRVVFVTAATVQDVTELLRSLQAEILAGPSSAGVFTLALPSGADADQIARQLRSHPRVRFAEPTSAAAVQP